MAAGCPVGHGLKTCSTRNSIHMGAVEFRETESSMFANSATRALLVNRGLQCSTNGHYYVPRAVKGALIRERGNLAGVSSVAGSAFAMGYSRLPWMRVESHLSLDGPGLDVPVTRQRQRRTT